MAWKCKECGSKIVQIDVVPYTIIREIRKFNKNKNRKKNRKTNFKKK